MHYDLLEDPHATSSGTDLNHRITAQVASRSSLLYVRIASINVFLVVSSSVSVASMYWAIDQLPPPKKRDGGMGRWEDAGKVVLYTCGAAGVVAETIEIKVDHRRFVCGPVDERNVAVGVEDLLGCC